MSPNAQSSLFHQATQHPQALPGAGLASVFWALEQMVAAAHGANTPGSRSLAHTHARLTGSVNREYKGGCRETREQMREPR